MRKRIGQFELVDHGIEHEQYFQGCGLAFTEFEDIATGIGDNPAEAIDDCLEQLACNDWDTEGMEERILSECYTRRRKLPKTPSVPKRAEDCHYYMSIRVKGEDVRELTEDEVTFTLSCEPEDISIEGNAMASGDDEADRAQEQWIRDQLDSGNEWAWCAVTVRAEWEGFHGEDHLGACSYKSAEDFKTPGGYYDDMKATALDALNEVIQANASKLANLRS